MSLLVLVLIAAAVLAVIVPVAIASFRVGRSRGLGEIFHIRMEAAQARRQMHELTREAFIAISEAAQAERQIGDR